MMRLIGPTAALFLLLAACAPQQSSVRPGGVAASFQPVGPAGYCLSDESDRIGAELGRSRVAEAKGTRILAVFRPCGETALSPSAGSWSVTRVVFSADPSPPRSGEEVMDREMYVTFLSNPKLIDLLNRRLLPQVREALANSPEGLTASDIQYLGSDDMAAYFGLTISQDNLGPMAPSGLKGATRTVSGQTVVAGTAIKVLVTNLTAGRPPEDWAALQRVAAQAIRSTIVSVERGAPAVPLPPGRQAPKATGSGLSA